MPIPVTAIYTANRFQRRNMGLKPLVIHVRVATTVVSPLRDLVLCIYRKLTVSQPQGTAREATTARTPAAAITTATTPTASAGTRMAAHLMSKLNTSIKITTAHRFHVRAMA